MPLFDAGGGGINVSKAISRLEGTSLAIMMTGGSTGEMLQKLLREKSVPFRAIKTESWTRENFVAVDDNTNSQFRFVFPAQAVTIAEKDKIMEAIHGLDFNYLVVSGGLS
jgi:6-phosphofructokinase 2